MKNLYHALGAILVPCMLLAAVSCNDNPSQAELKPPAPVSDATAATALGKVVLKWKIPDDAAYQYTRIDYKHPVEGYAMYSLVGKDEGQVDEDGYSTLTISDYEVVSTQEYILTARGFADQPSTEVKVVATTMAPDNKPYDVVAESISVKGEADGILVSWENDMDISLTVQATYTDYYGVTQKARISSAEDGSLRAGSFDITKAQDIKIQVFNRTGTRWSEEKLYPVSGIEIPAGVQLATTGWTVIDFYNEWNDESSPRFLIDGNTSTSWHTHASSGKYPYWATFDMDGEYVISSVVLWPRKDNYTSGPSKVRLDVSQDNMIWYDAGTFDFDNKTTNSQTFHLAQPYTSVRYLKLNLLEGPASYSFMAEIVPYGLKRE